MRNPLRILAAFPTGKSIPEPDFKGMLLEFRTQSSVKYAGATLTKEAGSPEWKALEDGVWWITKVKAKKSKSVAYQESSPKFRVRRG